MKGGTIILALYEYPNKSKVSFGRVFQFIIGMVSGLIDIETIAFHQILLVLSVILIATKKGSNVQLYYVPLLEDMLPFDLLTIEFP